MFCRKCGTELGEDELFCYHCGARVEKVPVMRTAENVPAEAQQAAADETVAVQPPHGQPDETVAVRPPHSPADETVAVQPSYGPADETVAVRPPYSPADETVAVQSSSAAGLAAAGGTAESWRSQPAADETVAVQPSYGPADETVAVRPPYSPADETVAVQSSSAAGLAAAGGPAESWRSQPAAGRMAAVQPPYSPADETVAVRPSSAAGLAAAGGPAESWRSQPAAGGMAAVQPPYGPADETAAVRPPYGPAETVAVWPPYGRPEGNAEMRLPYGWNPTGYAQGPNGERTDWPVPGTAPEEKQKKKKKFSRGKIVLLIFAVVLFLGILAGAAAFLLIWNSPKNIVLRSFSDTFKAASESETGIAGYLGLDELRKNIEAGNTRESLSAKMTIDKIMGLFSGDVGIVLTSEQSPEGEEYADLSASVLGLTLQALEISQNEKEIYLAAPMLYDKTIYMDREQLLEMEESGELYERISSAFGIDISEEGKDILRSLIQKEAEEKFELSEEYKESVSEDWRKLAKAMSVVSAEPRTFTIGGEEKSCKGYEIILPQQELVDVINNLRSFLVDEYLPYLERAGALEEDLLPYLERAGVIEEDQGDVGQMIDEYFDGLCSAVEEDETESLTAYVGSGSRLVCIEMGGQGNEDAEILLSLQMLGQVNPLEDVTLVLDTYNNGTEVHLLMKQTDLSGKIDYTVSMSYIDPVEMDYDISLVFSLDEGNGKWNAGIDLDWEPMNGITAGPLSLSLSGVFDDVEKGKGFSVTADHFELDIPSEELPGENVTFGYRLETGVDMNGSEIRAGEQMDILNADEAAWSEIGTDIWNNLLQKIQDLVGKTGLFGGTS